MPRRPSPAHRPLALALALLAAGCAREVEVTVVVDGTPLLEKARPGAATLSEAELGKRLFVKVPRLGTKPFWAVKDAKAYVKADDVAPYPLAGTPTFVQVEKLTVLGRAGATVKELRLGSPVSTFTNPALAARKVMAVVDDGVVVGFCDPAGVSAEKPPVQVFAQRVLELVKAGDFADANRFIEAGLAAYPGEQSLAPWSDLLQRAAADPFAFPPPGQRAAIVPEPALKKGAPAFVAPLAAGVLAAPKGDAKLLTVLRQNTPVKVLEIGGAFAKVELGPSDAVAWATFAGTLSELPTIVPPQHRAPETEEDAAEVTPAGALAPALFVRVVDLQASAATEESLVAWAKKAGDAGKRDEALELLSRAFALGDAEGETYEALFDAAIAAGDLERALWAALVFRKVADPLHALRGATGWSSPLIEEVALVQGCRERLVPGAAVEAVEVGGPLRKPRPGQCLVLRGPLSVCEDCDQHDAETAYQALRQARQAVDEFVQEADELYPLGPYLRVTVVNTSFTAGPPRQPLFVKYGGTHWVPILALGAYERVTVYVGVNTYRDVYGVSLGEDDPGEPGEDDGGTFHVVSPDAPIVWVGEADGECEECHRDGDEEGEEEDDPSQRSAEGDDGEGAEDEGGDGTDTQQETGD
jgi:hypothetical protein